MKQRHRSLSGPFARGAVVLLLSMVVIEVGSTPSLVAEPSWVRPMEARSALSKTDSSLLGADARIRGCTECSGVLYLWSDRMPLSLGGIGEIADAAEELGLGLTVLASEELHAYALGLLGDADAPLADAMLEAGALAHAPAVVVYRHGQLLGPALLGYKKAAAYRSLIGRRLEAAAAHSQPRAPAGPVWHSVEPAGAAAALIDHPAVGVPGAYFRWVPGRRALAYESGQRVYLLDLRDGVSRLGPGYVDFVPTPDGRYFVTPGPRDSGLTFYDGDEVFAAARRQRGSEVEPIFTDARMRDQYPSVGILEEERGRTRYRVLTSWFEGIVYRDYDVFRDEASGVSSVRPVGQPTVPCAGSSLSTPIMSQDGLEVAARDEETGTTKIFRILDGGRCDEVVDFGVATSKVAWHRTGRVLAFRLPRRRSVRERIVGGEEGIFLYDRSSRRLRGLPGSREASSLAFPEFVGDDSVAFLVPGQSRRDGSVFRVVGGIR